MKRTRHTPEQVINKLREAENMLSSGRSMAQVLQHLGVSEQTLQRWRSQYGGMKSEEASRVKALEVENARLKRLVAEKELDISILREANVLPPLRTFSPRRQARNLCLPGNQSDSHSAGPEIADRSKGV
jgi:putative transposase